MRKPFFHLISVIACFCIFTSCKDTSEKLSQDEIDHFDSISETFNGITEGKISSSEDVEQIEAWHEEAISLNERREELENGEYENWDEHISKETNQEYSRCIDQCLNAMQRLHQSKKLTKEIEAAIIGTQHAEQEGTILAFLWALSNPRTGGWAPATPGAFETRGTGVTLEVKPVDPSLPLQITPSQPTEPTDKNE